MIADHRMRDPVESNMPSSGESVVLLVTDSDETDDLVSAALESLRDEIERFPELMPYTRAPLRRRSSLPAAQLDLDRRSQGGEPEPVLIIVDALLRNAHDESPLGNGTAATLLLEWLERARPSTPVLVVTRLVSIERLDLKVLSRRNVGLWGLAPSVASPPSETFAEILSGLASVTGRHPRRITVEVGRRSARYRILDGHYEFTTDARPYTDPATFDTLIRASTEFSPYDPGRQVRRDWQLTLQMYGKQLFQLLLQDALGPAVLHMIEETHDSRSPAGSAASSIDLRFDIDLSTPESEDLFTLPFEVVNHDAQLESFLCARIPMARRIRLETPPPPGRRSALGHHEVAHDTPGRPLNVLFLDANLGGVVSVVDELTGEKGPSQSLDDLTNTADEIEVLRTLSPDLTVVDQTHGVGAQLRHLVETELASGRYNVFHFSGHSIDRGRNGTFLVFPGSDGEALAVSVRAVAQWMGAGACRLAVLSSCRGASLRTAIEAMRAGADAILGFRWDVDDRAAVDFFRGFYTAYLRDGRPLSAAYRDACSSARNLSMGTPAWASAVAVVRD